MKRIFLITLYFIVVVNGFSQSYDNNAHIYNVCLFGAKKGNTVYDGASTNASTTITSATASFVSADAGKIILVKRAGTSGRDLITTISSVTNSTTIVVAAAAGGTVSNAQITYGIDCTTAIQGATNAADANKGGIVYFPDGTYMIAGALQTSVGGQNPNSQIYIPYRAITSALRTKIEFLGETAPPASIQGGGLTVDPTLNYNNSGVILYSTLTSGATGCAVIGTSNPGGGLFNETSFSIKNMLIVVNWNPAGAGPVVGGVSMKNGSGLNADNVGITIDTTGLKSVYPNADVAAFETTDNNSEWENYLHMTNVVGFRKGYVIGEHVTLVHTNCLTTLYAYYIKAGYHKSTAILARAQWCAYDVYVAGAATISLFNLDAEWQQISKWYDDVATVKDSANLLIGNIFYTIIRAGVGPDNSKFVKSGGSAVYCVADGLNILTGTFAAGAVPFGDGTNLTSDATKLLWDNTGKLLSIGTTTHTDANGNVALNVQGTRATDIVGITDGTTKFGFFVDNTATTAVTMGTITNHAYGFFVNNGAAKLRLSTAGNVGINSNTDANSSLQDFGSFSTPYVAKTGTYTITATDHTIECTSGTFTVTLPTAVGITGREYFVTNSGSGTITLGTTSSQTFVNQSGTPTTLSIAQFGGYKVISNNAAWIVESKF